MKKGVPEKVKEEPENDGEEKLVESIRKISKAVGRILKTGLNRKAVIVLLKDDTGLSGRVIENVLNSLEDLERKYTV